VTGGAMDAGAPELGLEIRGDMERLVIEYVLAACNRQPGCIGTLWPSREIHPCIEDVASNAP